MNSFLIALSIAVLLPQGKWQAKFITFSAIAKWKCRIWVAFLLVIEWAFMIKISMIPSMVIAETCRFAPHKWCFWSIFSEAAARRIQESGFESSSSCLNDVNCLPPDVTVFCFFVLLLSYYPSDFTMPCKDSARCSRCLCVCSSICNN